MPADYSSYVNLKPHDVDAVDIYLGAQELARVTLPEFNLRQGTVEDAMFQAFSYMQMLSVSAINRLPNRLMEGLAAMMGVGRDEGSRSKVDAVITLNDTVNVAIPAGSTATYPVTINETTINYPFAVVDAMVVSSTTTRVASTANVAIASALTNGDTVDGVTLATGDKVLLKNQTAGAENGVYTVVSSGSASRSPGEDVVNYLSAALHSFSQHVTVTEGTANANTTWNVSNVHGTITLGTTAITYEAKTYPTIYATLQSLAVGIHPPPVANILMTLNSVIPNVGSITVASTTNFVAGTNAESDKEFLDRCTTYLAGLSSAAVTESQLSSSALTSNSHVSRARAYDLTTSGDRALNQLPLASPAGPTAHPGNSIIVAYGVGRVLTAAEHSALALQASNKTIAGLTIASVDPILIDLTVAASVTVAKNRTSADMQTDIKNALKSYLSVENFPATSESILASDVARKIYSVDGVLYVQSITIAPSGASSIAASEWAASGTTQGNILNSAGDPNIYYLSKGSYPNMSATTQVTLTITVAS